MNSHVYALTVHNDELFAGGWFTSAGGVAVQSIARWDKGIDTSSTLDTDGDGNRDWSDSDDDNDGVIDGCDTDPLNPEICQDVDSDGCDDCSVQVDGFGPLPDFDPNNDGPDTNGDGLCDVSCCTGGTMGNIDCEGIIDIGDVTTMIQNLFITLNDPCCEAEADIDQSGLVDIGDLTMLISSLFITLNPLPPCP